MYKFAYIYITQRLGLQQKRVTLAESGSGLHIVG